MKTVGTMWINQEIIFVQGKTYIAKIKKDQMSFFLTKKEYMKKFIKLKHHLLYYNHYYQKYLL